MSAVLEQAQTGLPLSPEQKAVLAQLGGERELGAVRLLRIAIDGPLDVARLRAVAGEVLQPHEAMRYVVHHMSGYRGLRQRCMDKAAPALWTLADLRGQPPGGEEGWVESIARRGLDPASGHTVAWSLARLADERWLLLVAVSPLVADRGSLQVLYEQLATRYGTDAHDAGEVFQYGDFIAWRQDLAQDADAASGREHWRRYLAATGDGLQPMRLSYRHANPRASDSQRLSAAAALDGDLHARVRSAAEVFGADAPTLLQAVWWATLARLNGHQRFVAGWQHDCRRDYEPMRGAVGVFEKVLPVVVDASADESFSAWLQRLAGVHATHIEAQEHWPVEEPPLQAHLGVGVSVRDLPVPHGRDRRWSIAQRLAPAERFELALDIAWSDHAAELALHADGTRYTQQALSGLLEQVLTLLGHALAKPEARLADLSLVGPRERERLEAWNATQADFGPQTIAQHIARWAEVTPTAPALEFEDRRCSYRELLAQADSIARGLRAQGVAPGRVVALNLPRSLDLVVALLAVWRAGGAYLPLEPQWPEARRQAVLEDATPVLVIHTARPSDTAPGPWAHTTLDELQRAGPAEVSIEDLASLADLAYVLYTSGSTGLPKGVAIEQGQLLNYVAASSAAMNLAACRRWALTSTVAADLGNTALFGALFNGACLVIAGPDDTQDAQAFRLFMSTREIDALKIVPSHLEALLECESPRLPCTLVLGGEAAPAALMDRIARVAPACAVYNHYGPTETTVGVMVHAYEPSALAPGVLPLSRVLANNRVHVLDEALRPAPIGALGEVYIGGAQLCRGYLSRDDGGVFVADPSKPGQRLYRTGDLAHRLPDDAIRLAGRADHQVKVRGYRVEPAEIEATLLALPGVRQAVVIAVPGPHGAGQLHAFVVMEAEPNAAQGPAVQHQLAERLPEHMVPSGCTVLADFPRLANGKVDRRALVDRAHVPSSQAANRPPRNVVEAALLSCMGQLLGRASLGIEDSFFDAGGNSLLAIKLVSRVRALLKVELALGTVFDLPRAAALAEHLAQQHDAQALEQAALAFLPESDRLKWQAQPSSDRRHASSQVAGNAPWVHAVRSQPSSSRSHGVPLFCFPGLFVNSIEYEPVASILESTRPVHRYVCPTLSQARWDARSLEALVAGYVEDICRVAGKGPVALLGWSVGGDLAFEAARQLQGKVDVRFVGLVDVCLPSSLSMIADASAQRLRDADVLWQRWTEGSSMSAHWQSLLSQLDGLEKVLAADYVQRKYAVLPTDGAAIEAEEYRVWAGIGYSAMLRRYDWPAGDVPTHVWLADGTLAVPELKPRDWSGLARVQRVSVMNGCDHRSLLLQPGFLRELKEALERIDTAV